MQFGHIIYCCDKVRQPVCHFNHISMQWDLLTCVNGFVFQFGKSSGRERVIREKEKESAGVYKFHKVW